MQYRWGTDVLSEDVRKPANVNLLPISLSAALQTAWFRFLCVAAAALCLGLLYIHRVQRLREQVQQRLLARLEERERIALELQDTLLQGFQGLILNFQAVLKKIPEHEPAHQMMERALDHADEVLLEGRQLARHLRDDPAPSVEAGRT